MTKTFNFKTKNNSNTFFLNKSANDSKTLDNIIISDIIKKNSYLFEDKKTDANIFSSLIGNNNPIIITGSKLKADDEFIKATKFLANYKNNKKTYNIPFVFGKMYKLSDGTPIVFYNDEIQIGFDTFKYADFGNLSFINAIEPTTKKIIINIYTSGTANIDINIL